MSRGVTGHAVVTAITLLAIACGKSSAPPVAPPDGSSEAVSAVPVELDFRGRDDLLGHPILPAGAHAECPVHHVTLADDEVPVLYGLPYAGAPGFEAAEQRDFPNAALLYFGGCELGEPAKVAVSFCSQCREAQLAWEAASAAAGHKHPYDEALRAQIRSELRMR